MGTKRKLEDNLNSELVDFITELADYEKNVNRMMHKYNAYRKAATSIAKVDHKITSIDDVKNLEGVGKKIAAKIEQYLSTGKIKKFLRPAHARKLVDNENIKSIDELRKHPKLEQLLNHQQQLGLKYLEEIEQKIPRDEMKQMEEVLLKEIKTIDDDLKAEIVGSYRRGCKSASSDIDILLTHPTWTSKNKRDTTPLLQKVVQSLTKSGFITDTMALGDNKFMFNRNMRKIAQEQGYTLNEYSLRKYGQTGVPGNPIPITCEEDIFDYLGMDYKEPKDRNE
ncbi:unnamed protein product [Didymodactylos carnosus]|uniref:DNA-directed DNA polymerase X domain-containing protein n=1 Tax=Didymodactylos carnosus TaxID=1234261 RepID=A0A814AT41_9BILA|nr:unnamed protein product [Didymodactylos carnosus]CAF3697199.1 unnamed protein product [Didymodactylos carnosus]